MKKLALFGVTTLAIFSLVACSSSNTSTSSSSKVSSSSSSITKVDKFANQAQVGEAKFNIQNASGNTANGEKIVILDSLDTSLLQIGYSAEGFDGTKLTYIYVDGIKSDKQQWGENLSQGSVTLYSDKGNLKIGTHKIEVVQYDTDKESGTITAFNSQEYTVK
ncbi:MAG: hypothetical protein LBI13_00160 [Streptococcaceae bacterium]|jgi:ABC-type Fe3+-hydroxamate transport system substrate-binding protein|nr:hypothetical protein [Streptococcaceae bacterium]